MFSCFLQYSLRMQLKYLSKIFIIICLVNELQKNYGLLETWSIYSEVKQQKMQVGNQGTVREYGNVLVVVYVYR